MIGAQRMLTVSAERKGAGDGPAPWRTTVSSYSLESLKVISEREVVCTACSAEQVVDGIAETIESLVIDEPAVGSCRVKVASAPPDGTLTIDRELVGTTPFEHELAEGPHDITIEKAGYTTQNSHLRCGAGGKESLLLRMARERKLVAEEPARVPSVAPVVQAAPEPAGPSRRQIALRALGGVSVVFAAAGIAILGASLALDGRGGLALKSLGVDSLGNPLPPVAVPYRDDFTTGMIIGGVATGVFAATAIGLLVAGFVPERAPPKRTAASRGRGPGL
jgi:hypothetical protein